MSVSVFLGPTRGVIVIKAGFFAVPWSHWGESARPLLPASPHPSLPLTLLSLPHYRSAVIGAHRASKA